VKYERYVSQEIMSALHELDAQIAGIKASKNPEYLHQLRVATRRLRTALTIFEDCFSKKNVKVWGQHIRNLARGTSQVRDLDVHVAFLEEYSKRLHSLTAAGKIKILIKDIRGRRAKMQRDLLKSIKLWEESSVFSLIEKSVRQLMDDPHPRGEKKILKTASRFISKGLQNLLKREKFLDQPQRVKELHEMRIAAKQLRYALETFEGYYGEGSKPFVSAMKILQTYLGEIHDFDVRSGLFSQFLTEHPNDGDLELAIRRLETYCRSQRRRAYGKLIKVWEKYRIDNLWTQLRECVLHRS
jgi:CHAD domain-containing protein